MVISAQYITLPKQGTFQRLLLQFMEAGAVKPWEGTFSKVDCSDPATTWSSVKSARYVGVPSMSSICRQMVSSSLVSCHFSCPVIAQPVQDDSQSVRWKLTSIHGEVLGQYDWLIVGDRAATANILRQHPSILSSPPLRGFLHVIEKDFSPIPCLSLMVAFRKAIPRALFPHDTVSLQHSDVLGWICRDSSKPMRAREDGQECWILQSTSEFARKLIQHVEEQARQANEQLSYDELRERVNHLAAEKMYVALVDFLASSFPSHRDALYEAFSTTNIAAIEGHRWSAARSSMTKELVSVLDKEAYQQLGNRLCYADPSVRLVACGDYLLADNRIMGLVEGAVCSGHQAARAIVETLRREGRVV